MSSVFLDGGDTELTAHLPDDLKITEITPMIYHKIASAIARYFSKLVRHQYQSAETLCGKSYNADSSTIDHSVWICVQLDNNSYNRRISDKYNVQRKQRTSAQFMSEDLNFPRLKFLKA